MIFMNTLKCSWAGILSIAVINRKEIEKDMLK